MKSNNEQARHVRDWNPIRNGDIYCSPACGGGCTFAAYENAHKLANSLAKRLSSPRATWTTYVHENLGWHYSVISPCGRIMVSEDRGSPRYSALFGEPFSHMGIWVARGRTAKAAVRNVIQVAERELEKIQAHLDGVWELV